MMFGNPERFGIQYVLTEGSSGILMYGKISYWICGRRVGRIDITTSLLDVLNYWDSFSRDAGHRTHPWLMSLDTRLLARTLYCGLYGHGCHVDEDYLDRAMEEQWARFDIIPIVEAFTDQHIFLIEDDQIARVIVYEYDSEDGSSYECQLRSGEFDEVLKAALTTLFEIYDQANSGM